MLCKILRRTSSFALKKVVLALPVLHNSSLNPVSNEGTEDVKGNEETVLDDNAVDVLDLDVCTNFD